MTSLDQLTPELQLRVLTHLRAADLSRLNSVNRYFWKNKKLQHEIVQHFAMYVYPPDYTKGFENQPTSRSIEPAPTTGRHRSASLGSAADAKSSRRRSNSVGSEDSSSGSYRYTFEHLRNMELLVVARVLNTPEPKTGYVVSKSWCKTALSWLESCNTQHSAEPSKKSKKKKKKKGKKAAKSIVVCEPCGDINGDITCSHDNLQHITSTRTARARRRLLDKQAWKILKRIYPESTTLDSRIGECVQCQAEKYQQIKEEQDRIAQAAETRKLPLKNPEIRRFYTRNRGVPEHCVGRITGAETTSRCPLIDGKYHILPRAWCHGWRKYIKSGGDNPAPDASGLLCESHKLALLPPHLEYFIHGESEVLLGSKPAEIVDTAATRQGPPLESLQAMRALGLSEEEIELQTRALRTIELRRRQRQVEQQRLESDGLTRNEMLDRENYTVVEILTDAELKALEPHWPGVSVFSLSFTVGSLDEKISPDYYYRVGDVNFCTPVCRDCDASGRYCDLSFRKRGRVKRSPAAAKSNSRPSLEY